MPLRVFAQIYKLSCDAKHFRERIITNSLLCLFFSRLLRQNIFIVLILKTTEISVVLVFSFIVPKQLYDHATAHTISRRRLASAVQFDPRLVQQGFVMD